MKQLIADLDISTSILKQSLLVFDETNFNASPEDGGWSAGQIIEHLWLVESLILKNLDGFSNATERPVDKKVELIQTVFSATDKRYDSPEIFVPSRGIKEKSELIRRLETGRRQLANLITTLDLSETLLAFKHPYLGAFTRLEWVHFIILHSNRHVKQLDRLAASFK
jgi:hypothetical protein